MNTDLHGFLNPKHLHPICVSSVLICGWEILCNEHII
jgi:hypothetical protein